MSEKSSSEEGGREGERGRGGEREKGRECVENKLIWFITSDFQYSTAEMRLSTTHKQLP